MMRKKILKAAVVAAALAFAEPFQCAGVEVVAVYYPHWHVYPKGNEWFHPGWTEWEYVKDAKPRFPGHQQPIVPLPGYLDGKNPADVAKEIDLAADAGINVFLYDYYYYGGEVTQEEAIEEGFLKAPNRNRMKFALMWCYHDRSFAWRCKLGRKRRFLMTLKRTPDEFLGMIDLSIARYFKHPEYWRRNGRLFFSIYNARDAQGRDFVAGLGADNVKAALAEARRRVRAAGLGEVEFNIQNPVSLEEVAAFKNLGFDSVTHYGGKPIRNLSKRFAAGETVFDYAEVGPELKKRYAEYANAALPYHPSVSTGWDSTPRCRLDEPFPWRTKSADYPYTMTLTNCTAALFEENLRAARAFAERDPANPAFVYINAWNEYTEGCYLLPDNFEGDARLKAIRNVFGGPSAGASETPPLPTWPAVGIEAKPWAYNWWMGSAVDAEGLEYQCREMAAKGFGGFHVIPIYGAKGWEAKYRTYLSKDWIEGWNLAVRTARRHGLGVDLTMGSGWCFGGPWITREDACSSGMKVKRAGPGGGGYMVDPFSAASMRNFIAPFVPLFGKGAQGVERPRAFYHDSYEYFGAKPKTPGDLNAMQIDAFKAWADWCHDNGYLVRNEGHGAPGNWLDLYALADMPETEMFATDRDVLISKFASSAAHVTGRRFVTSESCTWLAEHFTETLADFKRFIDLLLLSGVNHMFYHGLCYSPTNVVWPGWCFYASSEMNPRNPVWHDVGLLNAYVARCQSMFQACVPDEDTLLYWPYADSLAASPDAAGRMSVHTAQTWFHALPVGATARRLAAEGVQFDYVSDLQLRTRDLSRYARVVVPEGATVPPETAAAVAAFRGRRTARPEPFARAGLSATRFRRGGDTVYFIANTNATQIAGRFRPSAEGRAGACMNPMTGTIAAADWSEAEGGFAVALEGGESMFLVVHGGTEARSAGAKRSIAPCQLSAANCQLKVEIAGPWKLEPLEGGPEMPPVRTMAKLSSWSRAEDGGEIPFCGTMRYSAQFDFAAGNGGIVVFDLGDVRQSARVRVNGKEVGFAIMPPYRVSVPAAALREKGNLIEIDVTSTGANRIRHNDRTGVKWKYFRDANMIAYGYKGQLDARDWPLRDCGLLGPVTYCSH